MALTAYTGASGAGKSYCMVAEIILPAVKAGRRVVTNVGGLDADKVHDYIRAKWPDLPHDLGEIVAFHGPESLQPGFWPVYENPQLDSVVKGGDLVVFDEVYQYWPRRGKISPDIMKFLRMHRHFVGGQGNTAMDIVFSSQIITDFHSDYRGALEANYKFKKLKTLGAPRHYVWNRWEGAEQRKGQQVSNGTGKYDSAISALYKSYTVAGAGGAAVEASTDSRVNVFRSKKLWALLIAIALCGIASVTFLVKFFTGKSTAAEVTTPASAVVAPIAPASSGPVSSLIPAAGGAPSVSAQWRISGMIETPSMRVVVLVDRGGNTRYEDPSNFQMVDGRPYSGIVDGQRVFAIGGLGGSNGPAAAPYGLMGR